MTIFFKSHQSQVCLKYFKKNDLGTIPVRDVSEDQKVADRIAADVNKTPAELMKLRTQEGNWQNVILNLVSEQKKQIRVWWLGLNHILIAARILLSK